MQAELAGSRPTAGVAERPDGYALGSPSVLPPLPVNEVYAALAVGSAGLDEREVNDRAQRFGPNRIEEVPGRRALRQFFGQFIHLFALLLWAASTLSMLIGLPNLAVAIVAVIVLNGLFGFWQEHRAERAVAALKKLLPDVATVVRSGLEARVSADALVPGDVLLIAEGDRISADARLVEAADLRVDESSLTGESHPVHKTHLPETSATVPVVQAHNMIFAGTSVSSGNGRAVVAATGMAREFGRIAHLTQAMRQGPSPLELEVARVARQVTILSVAMGGVFFAVGHWFAGLSLQAGALFAVGIVIGNVPEGLLPTMTLALAMGVQRMAGRQAIVKRLSAVETLGACTVVCTDKTGTLTENEMTVRALWVPNGCTAEVTGAGYELQGELLGEHGPLTPEERRYYIPMLRAGYLCNAARLRPAADHAGRWQAIGDPTEAALLVAASKAGLKHEEDLARFPLVRQLAFEPRRKRMSTIHRADPTTGHLVVHVKGAPLELIAHCSAALVGDREVPLTADLRREAVSVNDTMARKGLRVLAMAYRNLPPEDEALLPELVPGQVEQDLVFVGLTGMQDPPRQEVPGAVARCRSAGIRVVMITGDYGLTAESIARQVGIVTERDCRVIEGAQIDAISDVDLRLVLVHDEPVFARATPEHKLRIVAALQELGEVVAVTGDGVNDAPALKKADIGVAMGQSGTDVAREAAEMVLADDNFATIVAAVEEGRTIFDNMRKFIVYIFAHLSPEAIPYVFFALFHTPLPLTVMQILAIDLGTETLPALALGVERSEPDVMTRGPRKRDERLLSLGALARGYGFLGLMTTAVVLGAFFSFLLM